MGKFATNASGAIWWANLQQNASGAIWWSKLQLMQVAPSRGQICNLCKWRHLVEKFATNASGAGGLTNASGVMLLLNLIQVTESISGSVVFLKCPAVSKMATLAN